MHNSICFSTADKETKRGAKRDVPSLSAAGLVQTVHRATECRTRHLGSTEQGCWNKGVGTGRSCSAVTEIRVLFNLV